MVKGINVVGPVEVGINAEHLAENGLADFDEILGKPAVLANPITRS